MPLPLVRPRPVPRARIAAILVGGFGTLGMAFLFGIALPQQRARARQEAVALNNQGYEQLAAGDAVGARALFEAALAKRGDYGEALVNLGHALRVLGKADSAALVLTVALSRSGSQPALAAAAHFNLAENDLDAGAYPSAVAHLERAEALDSTVIAYAGNRVFALVRAGRYPEALAAGQRALARFPGDPGLGKNVGYALVMSGRASEALPYLDRAIAASPDPGSAYGVCAIAYAALGRRADAARDWQRFLDSGPAALERDALEREYRAHGGPAALPAPGGGAPVPPVPPPSPSR
jgi:tetratricopeptide (TPR) repeat protein